MDRYRYIILLIIVIIYIIVNYLMKTTKVSKKYTNKLNNLIDTKLNNSDNKLFLCPFIELGDNIIINGAIRYLSNIYKTIVYVCKKSNYNQISYMYSDLNNIIYYIIPDKYSVSYINYYIPVDNIVLEKFNKYNIKYINIINSSTDDLTKYMYIYINNDIVKKLYLNLKLSIDIGYKYFKVPRDEKRENLLYNKLVNIIGDKYIVIIDDEKRNFLINETYLNDINLPVYKLSKNSKNKDNRLNDVTSEYIFDYIKILENADSIYSIDTSILWLIDFLNINTKTYAYCARNDICEYRNKNIRKLSLYTKDVITSNINSNNYVIKVPKDYILPFL